MSQEREMACNELETQLDKLREATGIPKDDRWTQESSIWLKLDGISFKFLEMFVDMEKLTRDKERLENDNKRLKNEVAERDQNMEKVMRDNKEVIDEKNKKILSMTIEGLLRSPPVMEVEKKGGTLSGAHVPPGRTKCTASRSQEFRNEEIPINLLPQRTRETPSVLLATFSEQNGSEHKLTRTFGSEADIRHLVRIALIDSVRIVEGLLNSGTEDDKDLLDERAEASMFSNKPDILVVSFAGLLGPPLFAVEVTEPWGSNSQEIDPEIWDKVYDL